MTSGAFQHRRQLQRTPTLRDVPFVCENFASSECRHGELELTGSTGIRFNRLNRRASRASLALAASLVIAFGGLDHLTGARRFEDIRTARRCSVNDDSEWLVIVNDDG